MRKFNIGMLLVGWFVASAGPAQAQDDAKAVLEKSVKAMGGLEKLSKHPASRIKTNGTIDLMGMSTAFSGEFVYQLPSQYKMDLSMEVMGQKIQIIQVLNTDKGWLSAAGMLMELEGDQLETLKQEAYANLVESVAPLLVDKNKQFTLSSVGEVKVNGKAAVGVKVAAKGHKDINLFFDKDTGLLVKSERRAKNFEGAEVTHESFFSDYKEVDGIKQPMKYLVHQDGKKFIEGEITEMKFLEKLDATVFAKP